jgi:hypothetical protein
LKNSYFLPVILFFTSCSILFPDGVAFKIPDYNVSYQTFNKRLDYNDKKYLLNPTQFGETNFNNSSNLEVVVQFFENKLGDNVTLKKDFKDNNDRLLIPFSINYDLSKDHIDYLHKNTNLNYIILSKILYLNDIENKPLSNIHKKKMYYAKAGAVSFIKIVDVKNGEIVLEMNCTGKVSKPDDRDFDTGAIQYKLNIHKDSYSLGEKTMKKLLKKIK